MKKSGKPALRNWTAANNALLRKGGVHRKSRKAERNRVKTELRRDARRSSIAHPPFRPSIRYTIFRTDHGFTD